MNKSISFPRFLNTCAIDPIVKCNDWNSTLDASSSYAVNALIAQLAFTFRFTVHWSGTLYHSVSCSSVLGTAYRLSGLQAYRSFGSCKANFAQSPSGLFWFPAETVKAVAIAALEQNFPRSSIPWYGPTVSPTSHQSIQFRQPVTLCNAVRQSDLAYYLFWRKRSITRAVASIVRP